MFTGVFAKAKASLRGRPVPVPVVPVPVAMTVSAVPPDIAPIPTRPIDVEDVRLGFVFGMQEVRIGLHAAGESSVRFAASLVGGR